MDTEFILTDYWSVKLNRNHGQSKLPLWGHCVRSEALLLFGYLFTLAVTWPWLVECAEQFSELDGFYPPMTYTTHILETRLPILAPYSLAYTSSALRLMLRSVWSYHPSQNPTDWIHLFMIRLIGDSMLCQCPATIRNSPPLVALCQNQSPQRLLHGHIGTNVFTTFTALERILASLLGLGYMSFLASAHHFVPLTQTCLYPPLVFSMKRMVSLLSNPYLLMKYLAASRLIVT